MPVRFDDKGQQQVEEKWNAAFTPPDKLDRQGLLDAFLISQAYQVGVDRLVLRSEKKLARGRVEMEISYERLKPDDDRFEVRVYDENGQLVRHERYNRADVERTESELAAADGKGDSDAKREARRRIERIKQLMPVVEDDKRDKEPAQKDR